MGTDRSRESENVPPHRNDIAGIQHRRAFIRTRYACGAEKGQRSGDNE